MSCVRSWLVPKTVNSMTSSADAADATDTESRLHELIARGYQFVHPRDAEGNLRAVVGVRAHHDVVDVVQLRDENDATATRMPGEEADVMAPSTVLWRSSSCAHAVLDDLLALPDERTPGAVAAADSRSGAKGCWVPDRPGTSRWLAASA